LSDQSKAIDYIFYSYEEGSHLKALEAAGDKKVSQPDY
jgi:hypothetical protein